MDTIQYQAIPQLQQEPEDYQNEAIEVQMQRKIQEEQKYMQSQNVTDPGHVEPETYHINHD